MKKTRFLVDESVDAEVVRWLRGHGWNADHVTEVGLGGRDDEDVLAFAYREDRILLTHDTDFLDDRRFPPQRNPGIVVLPRAENDAVAFRTALGRMAGVVGTARELWRQSKIRIVEGECWSVNTFERDVGRIVTNRYRFRRNGGAEIWVE
jgi:predicted nuclease of predicted toxin-antitoxin system